MCIESYLYTNYTRHWGLILHEAQGCSIVCLHQKMHVRRFEYSLRNTDTICLSLYWTMWSYLPNPCSQSVAVFHVNGLSDAKPKWQTFNNNIWLWEKPLASRMRESYRACARQKTRHFPALPPLTHHVHVRSDLCLVSSQKISVFPSKIREVATPKQLCLYLLVHFKEFSMTAGISWCQQSQAPVPGSIKTDRDGGF